MRTWILGTLLLLASLPARGEEEALDVFAVLRSSFVDCRPIADDPQDPSGVTKRAQEVAKGCPAPCAGEEALKRYKKAFAIVCKIIGVKDVAAVEAKYLGQGDAPCRPLPAVLRTDKAAKASTGGQADTAVALDEAAVRTRATADGIAKALAGRAKPKPDLAGGVGKAAAPGALSDEALAEIVYGKLAGAKDPAAAMKDIDDFLESQGIKGPEKEAALAAIREISQAEEAGLSPAEPSPQPQTAKNAQKPPKKAVSRPGKGALLDAAENAAEALLPGNPFLLARRRDERTGRLARIAELILGGANGDAELAGRMRTALAISDLTQRADALRPLITEADRQFQQRLAQKRDARLRERRLEKCAGSKACLDADWTTQELAQAVKEALDTDPDLGLYLSTRGLHQQAIMEQLKDGKLWAGLKLEPWEVQDGLAPPGARKVEVGHEKALDAKGGAVAGLRFDLGESKSVFEGLRATKDGYERITVAGDPGKQLYRAEAVRLGPGGKETVVRAETRILKDGKTLQSTVVQGATTVVKDFNPSGSVWRVVTEERKGKAVRKVVVDAKAQQKTILDFDGTVTLENTKAKAQLKPETAVKTVGRIVDGQFRHTQQEFAGGGKQVGHWHARLNVFVPDEMSEGPGKPTYFRDKSLSAKKEEDLFTWQGGKSGKEFLLLDRQMWFEQVNKIVDADGTKHYGRVERGGAWIEERSYKPDGSGSIRIKGQSGDGMLAYSMSLTEAVGKGGAPFEKLLAAAGAYAARSGLDKKRALPIAQWLFDNMGGAQKKTDDNEPLEYFLAGSDPAARFSLVAVVHANVLDRAQVLVGSQPQVHYEAMGVWAKAGDSLKVPYRSTFEGKLTSEGAADLTVLRGHDKKGVAHRLYMLDGTMWQRKRGYAFTSQGIVTSEKKHTQEFLAKFRRDSERKWVSKCKRSEKDGMVEADEYTEIHMRKDGDAVYPVAPCDELIAAGPYGSQTTASGVVGSVLSEVGEVPGLKQLGQFGAGVFHCTAGAGRGAVAMGGNLDYRMAEISSYHSCGGFENHSILAMVDKDKEVKSGIDEKVAENLKKDLGSDCAWMGEGDCDAMVERQIQALKRTSGSCGEHDKEAVRKATFGAKSSAKLSAYDCQRLRVVGYAYSADHAMDQGGVAGVLGVAMQAGETAASSLPMMIGAGGAQTLGRGFGSSGLKLNKAVINEFTALHRAGMVDAAFMTSLKAMGGPGVVGKTLGGMGTLGNQYISATAFLGSIDNAAGCLTESGSARMKACTAMAVDAVTFAKPLADNVKQGRQNERAVEDVEWDVRKKIATGELKAPPPPDIVAKDGPTLKPAPGPEAVIDAADVVLVNDPTARRGVVDTLRDFKAQAGELLGGKPAIPEASVLRTISKDGATGPVLEARLPDGRVAAVKQYSETGPVADANFAHETAMARKMDEALRASGMAPRFLGEVKVPGEGRAFAMEKIEGKPIHELTAKEAETLLSADTVKQIRDGVQALKEAGLGGKDSPQAMILTKDQIVNGKARKAGDVVFIDAGQLSTQPRSWDSPARFADAAADQVALARAGLTKHPGETIDQLALRRRSDRAFERTVDEARAALKAEEAGPVKTEPMTASVSPQLTGGGVSGAAARIKNLFGGFFGRKPPELLPEGTPQAKPQEAPVAQAKPQPRSIEELKPQYEAYMKKLTKDAFDQADAAAKAGKDLTPIYVPPMGGFHQYSVPGKPAPPYQGAKLHVSAAPKDALRVAELVGEYLRKEKVDHKFPSVDHLQTFLGDSKGTQGGKFITIYPDSPVHGERMAREIDALLAKNGIGSEGAILPPDFVYPGQSGLITSRPGRLNGRPSGKVFDVDGVEMDPRRVKDKGLRDDYIRDSEGKVMVDKEGLPIKDQRDNVKANLDAMIEGGVFKPESLDALRKMGWPVETAAPMKAVPSGPLGVVAGNAGGRAYTTKMFKSTLGLDEAPKKILDRAQKAANQEIAKDEAPGTRVVGTLSNETIGVQSLSDCGVRGLWNLPELRPVRDAMMGDYDRFLTLTEKIANKPLRDTGASAGDLRIVLAKLGYKLDYMQLPQSAEGLISQLHASGGSMMGSIDVTMPSFAGNFKHGLVVNGAIRGPDGQWQFVISDSNFKRPQLYSFDQLQAMELIVGKVERAVDPVSSKPLANDQIIDLAVYAHNEAAAVSAPKTPPSLFKRIFGRSKDEPAVAPRIELERGNVGGRKPPGDLDVKQTTAEPARSGDGGHGGNVSVEEISRPYDYFVIDKNGGVTPRGIGKMAKNIDLSKDQILALRDPRTGRIEIHGALASPAAQRRVDQYFKQKYPEKPDPKKP